MRAWVLLAVLAACAPGKPDGSCLHWSDCGEGGACEYSTTHPEFPDVTAGGPRFECSVADESCEGTQRRFGDFASEDRRGTCVEFSSGFDGLCDGVVNLCNPGLYCELGRCMSVRQLDATASLFGAMCANDGRIGGDVLVWGIAFVLGPGLFTPGVIADADPFEGPAAHFEAFSMSIGETHLCLSGETADADQFRRSECFGLADDRAVTTDPPVMGSWGFLTPPVGLTGDPPMLTNNNYTVVTAGKSHSCGTIARGVTCWGANDQAQLDGTGVATNNIGTVGFDQQLITHLTAGATFSCGGTIADVWCWGDGEKWVPETFEDPALRGTTQRVVGLTEGQVTSLDAGETHVCVVKGSQLWCWGGNDTGQSNGEPSTLPILPSKPLGDTPVLAVAAGRQHTCAVTADHRVMCWGDNAQQQLGSPTAGPKPVVVPLEARAIGTKLLSAGDDVTCALLEDSWVHCWGAPELTTDATRMDGSLFPLDRLPLCI